MAGKIMKYLILIVFLTQLVSAVAQHASADAQHVSTNARQHKTENVVIITMDGMRWQEVFGGIDSVLLMNKSYTREPDDLKKRFWSKDAEERREKLFPFFWTKIKADGQLYGNRNIGNYDQYLNSAHAEDGMIGDLWNTLQSIPQYRDKTTLIITCDHGRGDKIKEQWKDHGTNVEDSGGIWLAVIGPDTPPAGEVSVKTQLYQKQWAPTIAALLGFDFRPDHGQAETVKTIL
jgi:arylsulfatase A-like enzyme